MKLLSIIVSVVALAAIGVGGTLAVFDDVETSAGNSFQAGTLNLVSVVSGTGPVGVGKFAVTPGGDGANGKVVFGATGEGLKPGESGSITWTLSNTGSIGGTLTMVPVVLTSAENGVNEPETETGDAGEPGELDLYMGVKLTRDGTYVVGSASNYGTWAALMTALAAETQDVAPGAIKVYVLSWSLAGDLKGAGPNGLFGDLDDEQAQDNRIQSDSLTLDITFKIIQS